jgi:hypothetical protein
MNQSKKIFVKKPGNAGLFLFVVWHLRLPHTKFHDGHGENDAVRRRACFKAALRLRAALTTAAGLPCSDEQKKTRLRSNLSA